MIKPFLFVAAASLISVPAAAAPDPRSEDAVSAFDALCVRRLVGGSEPEVDPARFSVTELDEQTVRKIKPYVMGPLLAVSGTKSGAQMLFHYEPNGLCVVEVAEADEAALRAGFERLVQHISAGLGSVVSREPDKLDRIEDEDATISTWQMKSPKGDIMLVMVTYPDPKFMVQHLMMARYAK